jgi:hypothetical protein
MTARFVDGPVHRALTPDQPVHHTFRVLSWDIGRRDQYWSGKGQIAGTTKIKGTPDVPVSRRVRLFDLKTGILVRETWSDPATGVYEFVDIDPAREYLVVAHDHTRTYNAAVADLVTPEVA